MVYTTPISKPAVKIPRTSSFVFLDSLWVFIPGFFRRRFSAFVFTITGVFGAGNSFLAMFLIGLIFEPNLQRHQLKKVCAILLLRFSLAGCMAAGFYFLCPFPLLVRQILTLALLAPIGTLTPLFTAWCGGDEKTSGVINSLSIPIGAVLVTTLLTLWHV